MTSNRSDRPRKSSSGRSSSGRSSASGRSTSGRSSAQGSSSGRSSAGRSASRRSSSQRGESARSSSGRSTSGRSASGRSTSSRSSLSRSSGNRNMDSRKSSERSSYGRIDARDSYSSRNAIRRRRRRKRFRVQPRAFVFFALMLALIGFVAFGIVRVANGKGFPNPFRAMAMKEGTIIQYEMPQNILAAGVPEEWATLEAAQKGKVDPHISIIMVGDMLMHLNVTKSGFIDDAGNQKNYDHIFADVKADVEAADISIVNQEIMMGGADLGYSGYPMFNTADELATSIHDAGFNVVLHATNHTMDKWKQGLLHTMEVWKQFPDIKVLGINETKEQQDEIYVYEKDGMKIALLNYTYGLNGMPMPDDMPFAVNLIEEDLMDRNIKKAHEVADFVVVLIHWGNEYQTYASDNQKMWCKWFLDRDVDLIIGAHPHVIQPIEWYENEETGHKMLVYYSLGNFITGTRSTNAKTGEQAVGGMAKVELTRDDSGKVVIESYGIEPTVAHVDVRGGHGNIYTKFLKNYTEEDMNYNSIHRQDPAFTIQMCKDLAKKVWGDLYVEE